MTTNSALWWRKSSVMRQIGRANLCLTRLLQAFRVHRYLPRFDSIVSLGCLVMLAYFAWHAWYGPRGYAHRDSQMGYLRALDLDLATEKAEQARLEAKVALMRPEKVDPDMLEELARAGLEMSRRNELIVRATP